MVGDPQMTTMGILYQTTQQQATMQAFISVFHALMILVLVVTPVVFFMRSAKSGNAQGGAGH